MTKPQTRILPEVLNLIGFLVEVVDITPATAITLGGKTTAPPSDQYPNLFAPSGLIFSIRGVKCHGGGFDALSASIYVQDTCKGVLA